MTNEELVRKYQSGNQEALEELIKKNHRLVYSIALKYSFNGRNEIEDLVQEGFIGLLRAADMYDQSAGASFGTYVFQWIRQSIHRSIGRTRSVRIPQYKRDEIIRLKKTIEVLTQRIDRFPTTGEISSFTGIQESKVIELLILSYEIESLDREIEADGSVGTLLQTLSSADPQPDELTSEKLWRREVCDTIKQILSEDDRELIFKFYGFTGIDYTTTDLSDAKGVSVQAISQKIRRSMATLRKNQKLRSLSNEYIPSTNLYCGGHDPVLRNVIQRETRRNILSEFTRQSFYEWYQQLKSKIDHGSGADRSDEGTFEFVESVFEILNQKYNNESILCLRARDDIPEEDIRITYNDADYIAQELQEIKIMKKLLMGYGIKI